MITKAYMIPEENIESLEKKFAASARKIRKINPELEPTMTKSDRAIVLVRKVVLRPCDCRSEATVKEIPYEARTASRNKRPRDRRRNSPKFSLQPRQCNSTILQAFLFLLAFF